MDHGEGLVLAVSDFSDGVPGCGDGVEGVGLGFGEFVDDASGSDGGGGLFEEWF